MPESHTHLIRCACGDTDGPFEQQPDGSYRCEGCIKTGEAR